MTTSHSDLSLFQIESELAELVDLRDQTANDPDLKPSEIDEALQAINGQITAYIEREVRKVDGISHYVRECETRAEVLREEAKRLKTLADTWEARGERISDITLHVMQMLGLKKLRGRLGELTIKSNPPSVDVRQPDLVPDHLQRVKVTLALDTWKIIVAKFPQLAGERGDAEPSKTAIKEELKRGSVPGCELVTDKVRLEVK